MHDTRTLAITAENTVLCVAGKSRLSLPAIPR